MEIVCIGVRIYVCTILMLMNDADAADDDDAHVRAGAKRPLEFFAMRHVKHS